MSGSVARRELILQAVQDTLTALAVATVERNRRVPVDASEAPFLVLREGGHQAAYDDVGEVAYEMGVTVEGTVKAASDGELGPDVSALYLQIVHGLTADPTLGGLCTDVREAGFEPVFATADEADEPLADFTVEFSISFRTPDGDPAG